MSQHTLWVGPVGDLPLPWLEPGLQAAAANPAHALLLHAHPGDGALAWAYSLAQAWLCDSPPAPHRACGRCASCRLVQARSHPDLRVLLPEASAVEMGWAEANEDKRKPSRQIRIEELRGLIDWAQKTASRSGTKVALIHPAEAMNEVSANALLKTLEEPAPGTRLLLSAAEPARLLATVRSRCQRVPLPPVSTATASAWLQGQGLNAEPAAVLLGASGGHPLQAQAWAAQGLDAQAWLALPQALAEGQAAALAGWPAAQALDAVQKLCIDAMTLAAGGSARYFAGAKGLNLWAQAEPAALNAWWQDLCVLAPDIDHPWAEPLRAEAMCVRARGALAKQPAAAKPRSTLAA